MYTSDAHEFYFSRILTSLSLYIWMYFNVLKFIKEYLKHLKKHCKEINKYLYQSF